MEPAYYIWIIAFLPLIIFFIQQSINKKAIMKHLITSKRKGNCYEMMELAQKFIGKECLIYTFNSQITGVIEEVCDGALLIKSDDNTQMINLDFVIRIREYPKGKNGKKKSVIFD